MLATPKHYYSFEDYIRVELESELRYEYFNGDIYAMVGGSLNHAIIKGNVSHHLSNQLTDRGCLVLTSDLRVKTGSGLYTYPDLVALCNEPELETIQGTDTLLNPALIVEVLSRSTRNYDKEGKFDHYKTIASFSEYVLIDQYQPHITIHVKQADGSWLMSESKDQNATLNLPVLNCQLVMSEIYRLVDFSR